MQRSSTATGTTRFIYDGSDVVRDVDGTGATVADYLNGPGIDNKLRQTSGGTATYFLTDHLGTTRALADSAGNPTTGFDYDSFGSLTSVSTPTHYTYTGREFDSDTGLMYYRARWYDSSQGRFISEDPIGPEGGINWYSYVGNGPMAFTDPLGLVKCKTDKECRQIKLRIIAKTNRFFKDFAKYKMAGFVDPGGKTGSHGGKTTSPGGHYTKITNGQNGLMNDLWDYVKNCIGEDDPPSPDIKRAFEAIKTHVPWPANIPTIEELRLQEQSHRYMEQFWSDVLYGSIYGGAAYLGGPAAIRAAPTVIRAAPALGRALLEILKGIGQTSPVPTVP